MKKKVMHILKSNTYSGAEHVVISIIKQMRNQYPENEMVYVSTKGPIREFLEREHIAYIPLEKFERKQIKRAVQDFNPDIIHAHDFTASILAASVVGKIPIISHLHNNPTRIKKICHPYNWAYLISSLRYKKIFVVSKAVIEEYVFGKAIQKKAEVVGNPVDIREVQEKAIETVMMEENYDIIFMGRLTDQKDPLRFIQLMELLAKQIPNLKVAMVGQGEMKAECETQIQQEHIEKVISMLGFMENPYPVLNASKILCLPSKYEGYGLVAIEALALGKPVVASKVGGIPMIVDSSCGSLCDTDEEWIQSCIRLLTEEKAYQQKSEAAIQKANQLNNIQEYIQHIEKTYDDLMKLIEQMK